MSTECLLCVNQIQVLGTQSQIKPSPGLSRPVSVRGKPMKAPGAVQGPRLEEGGVCPSRQGEASCGRGCITDDEVHSFRTAVLHSVSCVWENKAEFMVMC